MTDATPVAAQLGAAVHQNAATTRTGLLERAFSRLFQGLVYAQIWEDPVADMEALSLGPGDAVFCIASGGCNAMSYLTAGPESVTAVDLSPAHVALLRLKAAAARGLTQPEFWALFGRADRASNAGLYDRLAPALDAETRAYWEGRTLGRRRVTMLTRGLYRYGVLGRFIGAVHGVARLGGVDFRPFLKAESLEAQRDFYDRRVAPLFEMALVRWLARRRASLFGLGIPPAQYDKLAADGGGDVLPVLRERVRKLMCDFPVADNYFAWQAFHRAYARGDAPSVPPYLEPRHFDAIAAAAPRVRVMNRSLTEMLTREPARSKSAYVFLDAQDWMTDAQLNDLWHQVCRTACDGATVIFRTGGAPDILPGRVSPDLLRQWRYDAAASPAGFAADRSAIYGGFHVYRRAA